MPIISDPEKSYADAGLIKLLDRLDRRYELYIVTGRSIDEIRGFLGENYNIIALHGAIVSMKDGNSHTVEGYERFRKMCEEIYGRREEFSRRFPGVRLYYKGGGITFTMWYVDPPLRNALAHEVGQIAAGAGMELYNGKMIVELRIPGVNKGERIREIRGGQPAIIAGDDLTDEDSFRMNPDALSIKVGDGESLARYRVKDYREFREILGIL